ncbi:MAG: TonB-dependent receptor [Brevundimonas sp.]|nr:TonB-dependent receptor [Brevundimonas sp.]
MNIKSRYLAAAGSLALVAAFPQWAVAQSQSQSQSQSRPASTEAEEVAQPNPAVLDDVVVTGYLQGLRRSIDEKRKNDMISDSVSADDMGKLPSSNLTEAASRIPGVSAVRNHFTGEGDRVVIRGMATEYNAYAVNGVRMGGTGSPNDNFFRGVRLSFLPTSGVDSITVYKSLLPYMDGDAIGGTIDIKTPTAFDYAPTYAAGSIEGTLLQQRDDRTSWAADVAFGKQFSDRLGLYVTGNYSERGSQFEQIGNSGDNMPRTWYSTTESLDFDPKTFVSRGLEMSTGDTDVTRWGFNGSLDYRGDNHSFHLRGQYNEYEETQFRNRLNFRNEGGTKVSARLEQMDKTRGDLVQPADAVVGYDPKLGAIYNYTPAQIVDRDKDGKITDADKGAAGFYSLNGASGAWDPKGFRLRRYWEGGTTEGVLQLINLGGESRFGAFTLDYDASHSESEDNIIDSYDMYFGRNAYLWKGNEGVEIVSQDDPQYLKWVLNPAGMAAVQDLKEYTASGLSGEYGGAKETLNQAQFNLRYEPSGSWLQEVRVGAKYYKSERERRQGTLIDLAPKGTMADYSALFGEPVTDMFDGRYTGLYQLGAVIDTDKMMAEIDRAKAGNSTLLALKETESLDYASTWFYDEQVVSAYVMGTARFGAAEIIAGVRMEDTDNEIRAWTEDPVRGEDYALDNTGFTNWLPSVHLNYDLTPSAKLRAAIWTSVSRPDINRMTSVKEYSYDQDPDGDGKTNPTTEWVLTGIVQGNPGLKPMTSINYDLSAEYYNGRTGAYSVALFYKDLDKFLYRSSSSVIRDGTLGEFDDPSGVSVSMPMNGRKAEIHGVEINARQQLHWLPAPFDGLGVALNATIQRSSAETGLSWHPQGYTLPFMETPDHIVNLELFWERNGWEAYVAYNYQDKSLEDIEDFGNDPYEQDYHFVDLMMRRQITPNLTATFKVQNLLDSYTYYYTFGSGKGGVRDYIENGRYLSLNLNWRL